MALGRLRPRTTEELLAGVLDRLRRLETRTSVTVGGPAGAYVLEVNEAGELTARHAATGHVTIVAVPAPGGG